eukprot:CAMPEP_0169138500 /NCGR_PEP_ID=MMETSP1015-20121227/42297_1 /TAXON_ID=342587 /ORGANISM="Karlodinium micrum, Strain CCMP2283" /LENGTH=155 /DNA_ID=CAMNT_0009203799 /DNA_START=55 /DNA_END=522 /DNA_ORIENTATION=-
MTSYRRLVIATIASTISVVLSTSVSASESAHVAMRREMPSNMLAEESGEDNGLAIEEQRFDTHMRKHARGEWGDSVLALLPQPSMLMQATHSVFNQAMHDDRPMMYCAAMSTGSIIALCLVGCIGCSLKRVIPGSDKPSRKQETTRTSRQVRGRY